MKARLFYPVDLFYIQWKCNRLYSELSGTGAPTFKLIYPICATSNYQNSPFFKHWPQPFMTCSEKNHGIFEVFSSQLCNKPFLAKNLTWLSNNDWPWTTTIGSGDQWEQFKTKKTGHLPERNEDCSLWHTICQMFHIAELMRLHHMKEQL